MPVFTAAGFSPSKIACNCPRTILALHASIASTRFGFCAVRQVITLVPCTPSEANVFRSAWTPAPPPLSDPAMVSAIGMERITAELWRDPEAIAGRHCPPGLKNARRLPCRHYVPPPLSWDHANDGPRHGHQRKPKRQRCHARRTGDEKTNPSCP